MCHAETGLCRKEISSERFHCMLGGDCYISQESNSNSNSKKLELELENNLFDKKYINVSTGYYKHTENDTHCRETLTLVQDVPLSREPPGKYK